MNRQDVLDLIASAPNGRVEQSTFFEGKHSQRSQLPIINLLASMRRDGSVSVTNENGNKIYTLPSQSPTPSS
jgi:hypothetical protein